jgi:PAS domain S-box-containing protein
MADKPSYEELEQRVKKLEKNAVEFERVEKSLRQERNFSESIIDSLPGIFYFFDDTGKLLRWNKNFEKVSAYSAEEILNMSPIDFFQGEDKNRVAKRIKDVFEKGKSSVDADLVSKNGIRTPYHFSGMRLTIDQRLYLAGMGIDMTTRKQAEETLKQFKSAVEASSDAISISTPEGKHWYQNKAFDDLFGEIGSDPSARLYVDEPVGRKVFKTIMNGNPWSGEVEMYGKDGNKLQILLRAYAVKDDHDSVVSLVGLHTDITERQQTEDALRASHERFLTVLDGIDATIYVSDMETYEILFTNKYMIESFGRDVTGKICWDAFRKESGPCPHCTNDQLIDENGKPTGVCVWQDKNPITEKWYINYDRAIEWTDGHLVRLQIATDITQLKQMEDSLLESEEKFRQLAENIREVFWVGSPDWNEVYYISPAYEEIWGLSCKSLYDKPRSWLDAIVEEDRERVFTNIPEKLEDSSEIVFPEYRIIQPDGTVRWILARAYPIRNELGEAYRIAGIAEDITERKQLEEELRQSHKMEAIGTLAGGIAHDFNNMLGIILGNTELAMDDVPEWNPARLNLEEIRTATLRARDVVRQLLSFARKTRLEKKPTNIVPIVKESLKLLRSSIPTSIDIRQNIPEDIDTILADPTQINQILINLCTNADHAMSHGGIIDVILKNAALNENATAKYPDLNPGRYVNLTVSDTGHGISKEDIDRIFDPYYTTKDVGKGTGMGLSVVHSIVKEHNGIITVKSKPGKGTTFSIFFPSVEKDVIEESEPADKLPVGNEKILFIDDEQSIVNIARQRLERLGYEVDTEMSPIEALELFRSKPDQFDLVITDLTMPKMTGDKLVKEILNIRPDIPIILCTGFSEKIDEKKATAIGAADYIEKPIDQRDFAFKVRKVLDAKKA